MTPYNERITTIKVTMFVRDALGNVLKKSETYSEGLTRLIDFYIKNGGDKK